MFIWWCALFFSKIQQNWKRDCFLFINLLINPIHFIINYLYEDI